MRTFRQGRRTSWWSRTTAWMSDPVLVVDLLQNGKAALAGVLAWVIAVDVLGLEQPFLAPWAAVLVVHATIFRTVSRGGQQVGATFAGVLLSWVCVRFLGEGPLGMGVLLVVAFLLGRHRWLREESTTVATTGIVVIATHAVGESMLTSRLLDTTVGVAVGLLVNLLVWPPLRDRAAWARADELPHDLADVLADMAAGLGRELRSADAEKWVAALRRVDQRIDEAWSLLWQARESARMNPRRSQPQGLEDLRRTLHLLEQAVADTLSMARTLATSAEDENLWDDEFRAAWRGLLEETAQAMHAVDEQRLRQVHVQLGGLAEELAKDTPSGSVWQEYGGLLVNLRNVVTALTSVAEWSARSGPTTRRSKRYPVPDNLPRLEPSPTEGHRHRRLRRRSQGYAEHDEHTDS